MTSYPPLRSLLALAFLAPLFPLHSLCAEPTPAALSAFEAYVSGVERRMTEQHRLPATFLPQRTPVAEQSLRRGELLIEQVGPSNDLTPSGALLHHWRGTAFVAGADAGSFERILKDFNAYPQAFAPEVLRASVLAHKGDSMQISLRVRQKHIITVVLDTIYDVTFGRLDPQHAYSTSRSTRVVEVDAAGTAKERALLPGQEHGFLWRLNTYWTYEERDGGLSLQVESVSLSRAIPVGLGWALRPYVESVPRESIEFTLSAVRNALEKGTR